ncbi:MAG: diadenylate cyclase CdaA [Myxococcota bacterium]|nr:diadenylate cyclase CdaA [Myxococcota bacterium]
MIEYLWQLAGELWSVFETNFDPIWDTIDILVLTLAFYWLLLLIRGTRAVQILVGLLVLFALSLASEAFDLSALALILQNFLGSAVVIMVVLFQQDIRRALARVGRGLFPNVSQREDLQILEEVIGAAQTLAEKRVGALIVLARETGLDDQIEAGQEVGAVVSKELLTSIFLPYSPLHDGAVVIQDGRMTSVGCILPLTLRTDLPEGVGTRHRAAVGITEETDAVVIVVSEETATISVVVGGEMKHGLDAPRLRWLLTKVINDELRELPANSEVGVPLEVAESASGA